MHFSDWLCCTIQWDHPFDRTEDQRPRTGHETSYWDARSTLILIEWRRSWAGGETMYLWHNLYCGVHSMWSVGTTALSISNSPPLQRLPLTPTRASTIQLCNADLVAELQACLEDTEEETNYFKWLHRQSYEVGFQQGCSNSFEHALSLPAQCLPAQTM